MGTYKGTVRNETKYAPKKQKDTNKRESALRDAILMLNKTLSETNNTDRIEIIKNNLHEKNNEVENVTDIKLNGLILRSKANIVENSEKNTKYFASLEKKQSEGKVISRLLINNTINTNQNEILLEAESYYKKYMTKGKHKICGSICLMILFKNLKKQRNM